MKNIGKPCAGEPHARFDEGGQAKACSLLYPFARFCPELEAKLNDPTIPVETRKNNRSALGELDCAEALSKAGMEGRFVAGTEGLNGGGSRRNQGRPMTERSLGQFIR